MVGMPRPMANATCAHDYLGHARCVLLLACTVYPAANADDSIVDRCCRRPLNACTCEPGWRRLAPTPVWRPPLHTMHAEVPHTPSVACAVLLWLRVPARQMLAACHGDWLRRLLCGGPTPKHKLQRDTAKSLRCSRFACCVACRHCGGGDTGVPSLHSVEPQATLPSSTGRDVGWLGACVAGASQCERWCCSGSGHRPLHKLHTTVACAGATSAHGGSSPTCS